MFGSYVQRFTLVVKKGGTTTGILTFPAGYDVTSWTFAGGIKKKVSDTSLAASFTFAAVAGHANQKQYTLSASASAALTCGLTPEDLESEYVYDMKYTDGSGNVTYFLEGPCIVDPSVS